MMSYTLKIRNILPAVIMAFACILSSTAHAEGNADGSTLAAQLNEKWNQAFNAGKPGAVAALYNENAIVSPGNGEVIAGRKAIEGLFSSFIENGVHDHDIEIVDVRQDGNTMIEIARWHAYGAENNGTRPKFGGILVITFARNQGGEWQLRSHVWNVAK